MATKLIRTVLLLLVLEVCMSTMTQAADSLAVGAKAPDFSLSYATRDSIASDPLTLSKEIGKGPIVLAFYPADWSGGCTNEVCTFRDSFDQLAKLHARIWAISGDYVYSHFEWAKHHNLPFELLADHDHAVAKLYNTYNPETQMNKRSIFVIGSDGRLAYINPAFRARETADYDALKAALATVK